MRVTFGVKSDYGRFKRFLKILETGRRWIAVESVAIRRDTEQPGSVYVQMELATYFAEPSSPAPSTQSPAPPAAAPARGAVPAARSAS